MEAGDVVASKYRLTTRLGEGATSVVWGAVNLSTQGPVALKLVQSPSPDLRRRLLREARAYGSLKHPHIVQVYDVGETAEGEPFLVMELLAGETLAARLRRAGRLPPAEAVGIATSIARALRRAHAAGVVHRDLKPANVFLHREPEDEAEIVKVLDFGVSKMALAADATSTSTGTLVGSPAYMSPEQARGEKALDGRSDLWSAGVVLFEMLAGRRPFLSKTVGGAIAEVLTAPIPTVASVAPDVPAGLSRIVARCLDRDLATRMPSAEELAKLLAPYTGTAVAMGPHAAPSPAATPEPPDPRLASYPEMAPALAPPPFPVGLLPEATVRLEDPGGSADGAFVAEEAPAVPEGSADDGVAAPVLEQGAPEAPAADPLAGRASPDARSGAPDVAAATASTSTTPLVRSPVPLPSAPDGAPLRRPLFWPGLLAVATAVVLVVALAVRSGAPPASSAASPAADAEVRSEPTSPSPTATIGEEAKPETTGAAPAALPATPPAVSATARPAPAAERAQPRPQPRPSPPAAPRPKRRIDGVDNPN